MNAPRNVAIALAVGCIGLSSTMPAAADPPGAGSGAVGTDCRVRLGGTWPAGDRFNGQARPMAVRPGGVGFVHHVDVTGTQFQLKVETLLCRRDGGTVPQHGGANIADATGPGSMRAKDGTTKQIAWQAHVEDRGAGREREDYFALRAVDGNGDEVYFNANFLATGDVVLTPVDPLRNPS